MVAGQKVAGDPHCQGLRQKARERPAGSAGAGEDLRQQTQTSQNADGQILSGNNFKLILVIVCFMIEEVIIFTYSSCGKR